MTERGELVDLLGDVAERYVSDLYNDDIDVLAAEEELIRVALLLHAHDRGKEQT